MSSDESTISRQSTRINKQTHNSQATVHKTQKPTLAETKWLSLKQRLGTFA